MDENTYGTDVVDQHWWIDGPHDDHTTRQAGQALAQLVRFLCHATGPGHRASALPYAGTANSLIQSLHSTVADMSQVLIQTARFLEEEAAVDPTLYDDRRGGTKLVNAAETAVSGAAALRDAVSGARFLEQKLRIAGSHTTHLGHDDPPAADRAAISLDGMEGEDLG